MVGVTVRLSYSNFMAYGTRWVNAANTRAPQYSLSWTNLVQFLVWTAIHFNTVLSSVRITSGGLFLVVLPVKFSKLLLPPSILSTESAQSYYFIDNMKLICSNKRIFRYQLLSSITGNHCCGILFVQI